MGGAVYLRKALEEDLPNRLPKDGDAIAGGPAFNSDDVSSVTSLALSLMMFGGAIIVFISFIGMLGAITRSSGTLAFVSQRF